MDTRFDPRTARRDVRMPWGWTRWHPAPGSDDQMQRHQIGVHLRLEFHDIGAVVHVLR